MQTSPILFPGAGEKRRREARMKASSRSLCGLWSIRLGKAVTFRVGCWGQHREQRTERSPVAQKLLRFHCGRGTKVEEIYIRVLESMLPALEAWLGCCRQALLQNTGSKCKKCRQENHPKLPISFFKKEKEKERKKENMKKEKEGKKTRVIENLIQNLLIHQNSNQLCSVK